MIWPYPGHARAKMRTALREGDVGVVLGELIFWVGAGAFWDIIILMFYKLSIIQKIDSKIV